MFESLTDRLNQTIRKLRGSGRLTEENIRDTLREVRTALLEADVALPVVKIFIEQVRQRALGQAVLESLTPGQALVKVVYDELMAIMGNENHTLNLNTQPPAVILLAGLQGAGKTTTVAKLGLWLKERQKRSVMVVSTDIYRPAAIEQLKTLATANQLHYHPSQSSQTPVAIAQAALESARRQMMEVLIIDTAGRLHIDAAMMAEIQQLHQATAPIETLFVVDSMTGQDAANTAKAFGDALPLTGVILTKTDGDARGGAALSVRHITGKPIKFIGSGEKSHALEPFYPDRIASRLLDMGDVLSLVEEAERKLDRTKADALAQKIQKGKKFDLEDFREQLQQLKSLGGIGSIMDKLPGMGQIPNSVKDRVNDTLFRRQEAIINSMTMKERRAPEIIKGSRKRRIAAGSGTQIHEVNALLKQFQEMQRAMKSFGNGGMQKMMRHMKGKIPRLPF